MTEKFDAQVVYLAPVLTSLLFGLGCAYLLKTQPVPPITVASFPEENVSALFGNAFYFVILIAVSALFFIFFSNGKTSN